MALTKIKIEIVSTVKNEGDPAPEHTKELFTGHMKYGAEGVERIAYKSKEGGAEVQTQIEPRGRLIRLVRSGAIESDMLFEVGLTHASVYKIPPFSFDMSLTARRTECSLSPFGGTLILEYAMEIGGAKKECLMHITVTPC